MDGAATPARVCAERSPLRVWAEEVALAGRVLLGVLEYTWARSRVSLPALVRRFEPRRAAAPAGLGTDPGLLARRVDRVLGRLYGRAYCLPRTLLLYRLLPAERGARIVVGIRREAGALAGHAWIECAGEPIGEQGHPRRKYTVTFVHPSPR